MIEPVMRGGAGVVDRFTSGTTAGPASAHRLVSRITFAVALRKSREAQAKVSAAVADYLGDVPGVVVVDELPEEKRLRLTVALDPPQRPGEAEALAEGCPHYVAGTFTWASG